MAVKFVSRTEQLSRAMREASYEALKALEPEALEYLRSVTPVKTGALRESARAEVDASAASRAEVMRLIISLDRPHAIHIEFGTYKMSPRAPLRRTLAWLQPRVTEVTAAALRAKFGGGR